MLRNSMGAFLMVGVPPAASWIRFSSCVCQVPAETDQGRVA